MDHKKSSKTTSTKTRSPEKTKGRNQRSATLFDLYVFMQRIISVAGQSMRTISFSVAIEII